MTGVAFGFATVRLAEFAAALAFAAVHLSSKDRNARGREMRRI